MGNKILEKVKEVLDQPEVESLPVITGWLSTGCTLLDLAITNKLPGGIARGRISQIYGAESTAKTVLGVTLLGAAQRNKMIGFYADVENTFDPTFAKLYGLSPDDKDTFRLIYPKSIEELFDTTIKDIIGLKDKRPKVLVTDTVTALPSEAEIKSDMKDGTYGVTRAKQIGIGLRKYIRPIAENDVSIVFIEQTRDNIDQFGPREVVSGGRAVKFYASTRIYLQTNSKIENSSGKIIGVWVKFQISKNKVGIPFREGRIKILFEYGLDNIGSNLHFLKEIQVGPKEADKKSIPFNFANETKKISSMIRFVEEKCMEIDLQKEVEKMWNKIYTMEERKQRKWE